MEESNKTSEENKWWKLKDLKVNNKFKTDVIESGILGGQEDWQRIAEMIRSIARRELGETSGKVSAAGRRETWWWNQEVQEKLKIRKKLKRHGIPAEMMQASWPIKLQESKLREKWQRQETRHMRNCTKNWKQRRGKMRFQNSKAEKQKMQGCSTSKSIQE